MLDVECNVNRLLLEYCRMLVADISEDRMAEQPIAGVNHPAWILGHLAFSADRASSMIGQERVLPASWGALFGPGSKPTTARSDYPSKDELVSAVNQGFERLRQQVANVSPEQWDQPSSNPYTKHILPTVRDGTAFLLTGHLGVHLGQLSTWRRMIGLPQVF